MCRKLLHYPDIGIGGCIGIGIVGVSALENCLNCYVNVFYVTGRRFLTYETDFVLFLAVLENSVLPTHDDKCDARTLTFRKDIIFAPPQKTQNDVQKRLLCNVK